MLSLMLSLNLNLNLSLNALAPRTFTLNQGSVSLGFILQLTGNVTILWQLSISVQQTLMALQIVNEQGLSIAYQGLKVPI
ncbi:hypothetical protein TUM4249_13550 [Shewanella sp. KT0246]|nr:hypothetical protein TUM4249_13550 [Shewanella sp. KT0246]